MCFVAMPFGKKPSPGDSARLVDLDSVYECFASAVTAEGLDCIRADFEPYGGFVHQAMFERLLLTGPGGSPACSCRRWSAGSAACCTSCSRSAREPGKDRLWRRGAPG